MHKMRKKGGLDMINDLIELGFSFEDKSRSGTFILQDDLNPSIKKNNSGFEIMSISDAIDRYSWFKEKYFFKAVKENFSRFPVKEDLDDEVKGYFIWVKEGMKIELPCQAAFYIGKNESSQFVHNIVVVEDNAELNVISGCLTGRNINLAEHFSVDEYYIGKDAKLSNTMVHSWGKNVNVYSKSGVKVDDRGLYESNYISFKTPQDLYIDSEVFLNGDKSSTKSLSIAFSNKGSSLEIGGDVHLNGCESSAELIHRGVCAGGRMYQKGLLIGNEICRGHVDCAGMLMCDEKGSFIESVPGIKAKHSGAMMSHEASIGKIAPDQVEYLQSRGMGENEAISFLIRGFLGGSSAGLGKEMDSRIEEIVELAGHGEVKN